MPVFNLKIYRILGAACVQSLAAVPLVQAYVTPCQCQEHTLPSIQLLWRSARAAIGLQPAQRRHIEFVFKSDHQIGDRLREEPIGGFEAAGQMWPFCGVSQAFR
jgi:hypothetical protein